MTHAVTRADRDWAEERAARLRRMIAALDADLGGVANSEWAEFWRDMRRLYSRAALHLTTAAHADNPACLRTGRELWQEIKDLLQLAERRLDASG
jgi:hypothetical protein